MGLNMSENRSMNAYIVRRIIGAIPLIFRIILLNFLLIQFSAGDPAIYLCGEICDPGYYAQLRAELGLDKSLHEQLYLYITSILKGNLGRSYVTQEPVLSRIMDRLPNTILLMGTGLVFAFIGGILLGVLSAKKPYSKTDNLTTISSLIGYSLPVFLSAQLLLLIFAIHFGWFPVGGMRDLVQDYTGLYALLDLLKHLALPALVIGVYQLAIYTRLTRASMLDI